VLAVRGRLAENPWAQVGAEAISWELSKLGGPAAAPPKRTIEEILRRAGVTGRGGVGAVGCPRACHTQPRPPIAWETWSRSTSSARVTWTAVWRFHALNQIDVASHHAGIEIITDRGDQRVLGALHALWGRHGVPQRIQFDNGGPFVSPTGLGEGRAGLPAPAHHARLHPDSRTVAQRHDRALQRHVRQALLPPRAFHGP